jgi:hypothetical protein
MRFEAALGGYDPQAGAAWGEFGGDRPPAARFGAR